MADMLNTATGEKEKLHNPWCCERRVRAPTRPLLSDPHASKHADPRDFLGVSFSVNSEKGERKTDCSDTTRATVLVVYS